MSFRGTSSFFEYVSTLKGFAVACQKALESLKAAVTIPHFASQCLVVTSGIQALMLRALLRVLMGSCKLFVSSWCLTCSEMLEVATFLRTAHINARFVGQIIVFWDMTPCTLIYR